MTKGELIVVYFPEKIFAVCYNKVGSILRLWIRGLMTMRLAFSTCQAKISEEEIFTRRNFCNLVFDRESRGSFCLVKSRKFLPRENFPLYGINFFFNMEAVVHCHFLFLLQYSMIMILVILMTHGMSQGNVWFMISQVTKHVAVLILCHERTVYRTVYIWCHITRNDSKFKVITRKELCTPHLHIHFIFIFCFRMN